MNEVFHKKISECPFKVPNFLIEDNSTKPIKLVKKKIRVSCINGYDITSELKGSYLLSNLFYTTLGINFMF